jgi:ATP-dependent RNA helicase SUPV3L1/SUV3
VVKAVLGPTNTGKTHLAIERLCAHSSGAIGFPLRLLAREVYDRVCAIKGADRVALITGEERIEPKNARWLLCTAEAMPSRPDLAFVALDEAQLSADPERGHVFTDRLLHTRGREETMLLGSATLQPMVRALVPEAEVIGRPRFSTLSHVGAKKLSRIPRAARSSPSRPNRSMPWRKCCAASGAARRWSWARSARRRATPRWRCTRRARSITSSPPMRSAWA